MIFEYEFSDLQIKVGHVFRPSRANPDQMVKSPFWTGSFDGRALIDMDHAGSRIAIDEIYLDGWADLGRDTFEANDNRAILKVVSLDPLFNWLEEGLLADRKQEIIATFNDAVWERGEARIDPNDEHRTHQGTL